MKCKDCFACVKGWFGSNPLAYVCIGVKEPFVINDINAECTEYKKCTEYKDRREHQPTTSEQRSKTNRYIDADKFIEWLDIGHLRSPSEICYSEEDVKVMIDMQPTVNINSTHGKWRLHDDGSGTCDQCRCTQKNVWDYDNWQKYCGVCGAEMSI